MTRFSFFRKERVWRSGKMSWAMQIFNDDKTQELKHLAIKTVGTSVYNTPLLLQQMLTEKLWGKS